MTTNATPQLEIAVTTNDVQQLINNATFLVGRENRGVVTDIGMFGSPGYVDNPNDVTHYEKDHSAAKRVINKVYKVFDKANIDCDVRYPSDFQNRTLACRSKRDQPFHCYKFPVYVSPTDEPHLYPEPIYDTIVETLQSHINENNITIHAIEFTSKEHSLGEYFRAVYPWVEYIAQQQNRTEDGELDEPIDIPEPIEHMMEMLRKQPKLPEYHVITITAYVHDQSYSKPDFSQEYFNQSQDYTHIFSQAKSPPEKEHLNNADLETLSRNTTQTISLSIDTDIVERTIDDTDHPYQTIETVEDYAKWIGNKYFINEHNLDKHNILIGVVDITQKVDPTQTKRKKKTVFKLLCRHN